MKYEYKNFSGSWNSITPEALFEPESDSVDISTAIGILVAKLVDRKVLTMAEGLEIANVSSDRAREVGEET